jgi:D-alanyl-D-alanine dipeptidase
LAHFIVTLLFILLFSCKNEKGQRDILESKESVGYEKVSVSGNDSTKAGIAKSGADLTKSNQDLLKAFEGKLVEVINNSGIVVRLNYASNKIFCTPEKEQIKCLINEPLYTNNRCFLKKETKDKLQTAALYLQKQKPGYKIVMLDCYRPISVQKIMFDKVGNSKWVAPPTPPKYSAHNKGTALDATIQDTNGVELDMGSLFDEFTDRSQYSYSAGSGQTENRKLLRDVFLSAGFKPYDFEWWHFSIDLDSQALDIPL